VSHQVCGCVGIQHSDPFRTLENTCSRTTLQLKPKQGSKAFQYRCLGWFASCAAVHDSDPFPLRAVGERDAGSRGDTAHVESGEAHDDADGEADAERDRKLPQFL
jgi:hypothetical protein